MRKNANLFIIRGFARGVKPSQWSELLLQCPTFPGFTPFILFSALLFFAKDFKRPKSEDAIAGNPSGGGGEHSCSYESDGSCQPFDVKAHFELVQQHPREQVSEDHSHCSGEQTQHAEFHAESAHNAHACSA